jgi:hypothetical protein
MLATLAIFLPAMFTTPIALHVEHLVAPGSEIWATIAGKQLTAVAVALVGPAVVVVMEAMELAGA